ncbi:clarin-3 [Nelusetta ayraudi]|uniref:clarin-3 n=1 Tax=Nelusetta ayraudi TaxID=303726 RepID=UPI003F6E5E6F
MPSRGKTQHYLGSALLTAVAVALLGYGMSADWSTTTFSCSSIPNGTNITAGNAVVTLKLFEGTLKYFNCTFLSADNFEEQNKPFHFIFHSVIPRLLESERTSAALQITVVTLLFLCLLCSAATILVSLYNSVSNPYQTYMGPIGIYSCGSLSAVSSLLVLILHACNVFLANAYGVVVKTLTTATLDLSSSSLQVGYYMTIPYLVLSLAAVGVIYKYQKTAYKQRKEQQKPTEDAPKEIMMY